MKCKCMVMEKIEDEICYDTYTITYECGECGKRQKEVYRLVSSKDEE